MTFKCGIVGLPNVGKSTLFSALSGISAEVANYPFCTIEPNSGIVPVPDDRLLTLSKIAGSREVIPTKVEFMDIAGLVKGASKGEGLGNQFLGHIREVDAIIHVVRCFGGTDIIHTEGAADPLRDIDIINTELMLADIDSLAKRIPAVEKKAKSDKAAAEQLALMQTALKSLEKGEKPADGGLITAKPVLYVCNVDEDSAATGNDWTRQVAEFAAKEGNKSTIISAKIEREIASLETAAEKQEFLAAMGISETGLAKIIREGYNLLGLISFFTVGPKEAHAWTVHRGARAPQAAGVIHTDFEKGFIRAETVSYDDFVKYNGEQGAREAGRLRTEGKDYEVADGDLFHFLFNN